MLIDTTIHTFRCMNEYMKCAECVCNAVAFIKKLAECGKK